MNITQTFYDNLSEHYDKLFLNWEADSREQASILDRLFREQGFSRSARILDCACGIGTQAIGLACLGYQVTASDISEPELDRARKQSAQNLVSIRFEHADFRALENVFPETFEIIIAMDNALPHMLSHSELSAAIESITGRMSPGGIFVASIRDYDDLLTKKPSYSPPYIHPTGNGQRVSFQTWKWEGENYKLTQYIIEDEETLQIHKFDCEYRATRTEELTSLLKSYGCREVIWKYPQTTGFYQPIVVARK